MLRPYLKIWEWELIFGLAVKAISSPGVHIPWDGPRAGYKPHHFNARQPAYSSVSILGMVRLGLLYFHIHLILKRKKGRMDTYTQTAQYYE